MKGGTECPGQPRSKTLAAWVSLVICLGITAGLWRFETRRVEEAERREIEQLSADLGEVLKRRIDAYLDGLRACRGLFAASKSVERDEWRAFVTGMKLAERYAGVRAMNFVRSVPAGEKAAFVARVRRDGSITPGGYPGFDIHPGGERESYQVIEYLEPLETNAGYLGLDLGFDPEAHAVLMRVRDSGDAGASGCYAAPGAADGRAQEFLLVLPIYRNGQPVGSAAERRLALDGFVTQHFGVEEFFSSVFIEVVPMNTRLLVRDLTEPAAGWTLWSRESKLPVSGNGSRGRHAATNGLAVAGRRWELRLESLPAFAVHGESLPFLVLVFGTLISILVFAIAWSLGTSRARALALAERMTSELRRSESLTRTIIDTALDAVITIDHEGRITRWSPQAEEIFGWTAGEAIGEPLAETIIPPAARAAHAAGLRRYMETGESSIIGKRIEVTARRRDGGEFPAELAVAAISAAGSYIFSAFVRDITRRKQVEADLKRALADAQAAVRAKSEFLATVSHEIRTPLNAVIGMTGLLLDTGLKPEQREFADMVRSAGEALLAIVNDILDFSKIEAGKLDLEVIEFDIREAVEDAVEIFCWVAREKGLELSCLVRKEVPERLRGDPGRIRQVLLNLIGNAVKFTMQGEIVVRCLLERATDADALLRFEVADTGIGISPESQADLFKPFTQADSSTTRKFGGTGLGLAISRRLSELMGGEIGARSAAGMGSTFWFTVRLGRAAETPGPASEQAPPWLQLAGKRALIVSDSATTRKILSHYLTGWGLIVAGAEGAAALDRIRAAREARELPDLVVADMRAQGLKDSGLFGALEEDSRLRERPVIFLGSPGDPGWAEERAIRAKAVLSKPARSGELRDAILRVLGMKGREPSGAPGSLKLSAPPGEIRGRILVAEDNPVNQKVAVRMLQRLSFRADVVANGQEAVEAAMRIPYDAVLMDCLMPELDGLEAASEIRRREGTGRRTIIVALTANAMKGDAEKCRAAGMDDYLAKPIRLEVLEAMLRKWKVGEVVVV